MGILKQFVKFSGFALLVAFSCYLWLMTILFKDYHWAIGANAFILILFGMVVNLSSKKESDYLSLIMIIIYFLGAGLTYLL